MIGTPSAPVFLSGNEGLPEKFDRTAIQHLHEQQQQIWHPEKFDVGKECKIVFNDEMLCNLVENTRERGRGLGLGFTRQL